MSLCLRVTAIATCALLAACGPRDARYNPSHFAFSGAAAPPEIILRPGTKAGSRVNGILAIGPTSDIFCCPADAHVKAQVRKDRAASTLQIGTYVSPGPRAEVLTVTFADGSKRSTGTVATGFSVSSVPVPKSLRALRGVTRIRIDATVAPYTLASVYFE